MVTTDVDLSDRLINGQIGTVKYFGLNQNEVDTIYVAFDDSSARQKRINGNDVIARNNRWVQSEEKRHQYTLVRTGQHHQPLAGLSFLSCYHGHVQSIKCNV